MVWSVDDAWPEPTKSIVRRRVVEIQRREKTAEEKRRSRIERLRRKIAKLEKET